MASKRRRLSRLQRVRIFNNNDGICCLCWLKIDPVKQKWIVEHIKPLWLSGADDESNMAPAHQHCAIEKTSEEAAVKAKSDRQCADHLCIPKAKRPMPFGRASKWKRKISGEVVLRETD